MEKSSTTATFTAPAGDARIKASMIAATFAKGSSLNDLALSLEKTGLFINDYNVPNQAFRFQFMNTLWLLEKLVGLTYTHVLMAHQTAVDGSLAFDPANKLSVNYSFGSGDCKVVYVYAHRELMRTVLEPTYDVSKNTWDFE